MVKLHDECAVWIDEQKAVADKLIYDFTKRFQSSYHSQRYIADLGLPPIISDHENNELIRLPNLEEVKNALFSI